MGAGPGISERRDYAERQKAHLEIFGLAVSNIPDTHMVGLTTGSESGVRVHGYTHNGVARQDRTLE